MTDKRDAKQEAARLTMAEVTEALGPRARVLARSVVGPTMVPQPLSPGVHLFVDWRFVQPGELRWIDAESGRPYESKKTDASGLIDARAAEVEVPKGVRVSVCPAHKGEPFPEATQPGAISPGAHIHHVDGRYLSWIGRRAEEIALLESSDGWGWRTLGRCTFDFSANPEAPRIGGAHNVFIDAGAPAPERFKMVFRFNPGGASRREFQKQIVAEYARSRPDDLDPYLANCRGDKGTGKFSCLYGAVSADGLHWKVNKGPLSVKFSDTTNIIHYDADLSRYVWYSRNWYHGRRAIGRAESETFATFPAPPTIVFAGLEDDPADDWYTSSWTAYPGTHDYQFLFSTKYNHASERSSVFAFSSPEGLHWARLPGGPIIETGDPGEWDGGCVFAGGDLFHLDDDKVALPFVGYRYPHKYPRNDQTFRSRVAYAWWPRGRIASLEAKETGSFSTFAFMPAGKRLALNLSTLHSGSVRVEAVAPTGETLPGRSFADCRPLAGDGREMEVAWRNTRELVESPQQAVMLRFELRHAQLFSFEVK